MLNYGTLFMKKRLRIIFKTMLLTPIMLITLTNSCSIHKKVNQSWSSFKEVASHESAAAINDAININDWSKSDPVKFINKIAINEVGKTLSISILNSDKKEKVDLIILYYKNINYNIKHWVASDPETYQSWDDFKDAAMENYLVDWEAIRDYYNDDSNNVSNKINFYLKGIDAEEDNTSNLKVDTSFGASKVWADDDKKEINLKIKLMPLDNSSFLPEIRLNFINSWNGNVFQLDQGWSSNYDSSTFSIDIAASFTSEDVQKGFKLLAISKVKEWTEHTDVSDITLGNLKNDNNAMSISLTNKLDNKTVMASIHIETITVGNTILNKIYGYSPYNKYSNSGWIFRDM